MSFETSDNLPRYFKTIAKSEPLTIEQEKQIATRIRAGEKSAVDELVAHNLKIVVTIANRHIGQGVPLDDLIQEGNLGLYEAATRFEPKEGVRFVSYASLWIRKFINEAVVAHGRIVRLPHNQEYDIYKAKMAGEETPNLSTVKLDAPIGDDSDTTIGDILLNTQAEFEIMAEAEHLGFTVRRVIGSIRKTRDQEIVRLYFGIGHDEESSSQEIAQKYDLTTVRVSQIIKSALEQMKSIV
jgi:RNA polymerase primary sigma factor